MKHHFFSNLIRSFILAIAIKTGAVNLQTWESKTPQKTSSKRLKGWKKPKIKSGELTRWHWLVIGNIKNLKMGKYVDIGAFAFINCQSGVIIEDEVQIGPGAKILSSSTIDGKYKPVVLKKNCRIGANSVVMPGITVGENAIVGALSFVNRNIPPNEVWVGGPVKKLKSLTVGSTGQKTTQKL